MIGSLKTRPAFIPRKDADLIAALDPRMRACLCDFVEVPSYRGQAAGHTTILRLRCWGLVKLSWAPLSEGQVSEYVLTARGARVAGQLPPLCA